jgi:glycine oxidase
MVNSASFSNSKFAIVGGGLMGRLLAVALARQDAQVELFDKGHSNASGAAARIAAAMLAPLAESAITEDSVVRMGIHSLPRWKELISQLSTQYFFNKMAH